MLPANAAPANVAISKSKKVKLRMMKLSFLVNKFQTGGNLESVAEVDQLRKIQATVLQLVPCITSHTRGSMQRLL
jgi:hypothetical protein